MITEKLKLQKQIGKIRKTKTGTKEYSKFVFVIPPDVIKLMNWGDTNAEFEAKAHPKTGKLTIEKKK